MVSGWTVASAVVMESTVNGVKVCVDKNGLLMEDAESLRKSKSTALFILCVSASKILPSRYEQLC
jgi:hypothetical protein